jgi:hypothetical protein
MASCQVTRHGADLICISLNFMECFFGVTQNIGCVGVWMGGCGCGCGCGCGWVCVCVCKQAHYCLIFATKDKQVRVHECACACASDFCGFFFFALLDLVSDEVV